MKWITLFVIVGATWLTGCVATQPPQRASLDIQAIQSRYFTTSKEVAFAATMSVFQDLGYIVQSGELQTGFITAQSPAKSGFVPFQGMVTKTTRATAFVEEHPPGKTRVRLNFVDASQRSGGYGMTSATDRPIENPQIYQNAFDKITEAVFIRSATQ